MHLDSQYNDASAEVLLVFLMIDFNYELQASNLFSYCVDFAMVMFFRRNVCMTVKRIFGSCWSAAELAYL